MASSYEELLRQVASLKKENNLLRRELGESETNGSTADLTNVSEGPCDDVAMDTEEYSELHEFCEMSENPSVLANLEFKRNQLASEIDTCQSSSDESSISVLKNNLCEVELQLKNLQISKSQSSATMSDAESSGNFTCAKPDDYSSKLQLGSWNINDTEPKVQYQDNQSVISFKSVDLVSNAPTLARPSLPTPTDPASNSKVEMIYSLLLMLGNHDKSDMSKTLLTMSRSQESCNAMRQSGCLPLLIQLLHGDNSTCSTSTTSSSALNSPNKLLTSSGDSSSSSCSVRTDPESRLRASKALHNIVHSHPDDNKGRKEARALRLLEHVRAFINLSIENKYEEGNDHDAGPAVAVLMRLSFDEHYRHAICTLGGVQAIGELLTLTQSSASICRYACMTLTNLTFGDGANKALLCSMTSTLCSIVAQLSSSDNDLRQVSASVLRNLSWRADLESKRCLRECGCVRALMMSAMMTPLPDVPIATSEAAMKSILSALWNLSAHCTVNKETICDTEGALAFLIDTLSHCNTSIVENGGGVFRNVSSVIAASQTFRQILRQRNTLQILLQRLKSPSLIVVSNACGSLWNLSARCLIDQHRLWTLGAVAMLRRLVDSRHRMIATGSAAALKNLLAARVSLNLDTDHETPPTTGITSASSSLSSSNGQRNCGPAPSSSTDPPLCSMAPPASRLHARRARDLLTAQEEVVRRNDLDETCDNVETPTQSPSHTIDNMLPKCTYKVKPPIEKVTSSHDVQESDEPINFSIRFAENETGEEDQRAAATSTASTMPPTAPITTAAAPTRGSTGEGSNSKPRQTLQPEDEENLSDRDHVMTYCTEGTPLNFLSTAPSLTDLTNIGLSQGEHHQHDMETLNSDERLKFCTEDTPMNFSHQSSLSSLATAASTAPPVDNPGQYAGASNSGHAHNDADECKPQGGATRRLADDNTNNADIYSDNHPSLGILASIDENTSLQTGQKSITPSMSRMTSKSVTFDIDHSPMMFSRSSSLGSLSSFDTQSIHSSVISEYSRRASQVVSPSELPDSPSDSMPSSPRSSRFVRGRTPGLENSVNLDNMIPTALWREKPQHLQSMSDQHTPRLERNRMAAGAPGRAGGTGAGTGTGGGTSGARGGAVGSTYEREQEHSDVHSVAAGSELSALTLDEPVILKDSDLRTMPLGEEEGEDIDDDMEDLNMTGVTVIASANRRSIREDHMMLERCISSGMPSQRGDIVPSHRLPPPPPPLQPQQHRHQQPPVAMVMATPPFGGRTYHRDSRKDSTSDDDQPLTFATEDTPLAFSRAESDLSDISLEEEEREQHGDLDPATTTDNAASEDCSALVDNGNKMLDLGDRRSTDHSDSIDGDDPRGSRLDDRPQTAELSDDLASDDIASDDILSAAIEAGKPPARPKRTSSKLRSQVDVVRGSIGLPCHHLATSTPDHGSPYNAPGRGGNRMMSKRRTPNKNSYASVSITPAGLGFDTPPRQYEMEGTPHCFSSNSSLSSLASSSGLNDGMQRIKLDFGDEDDERDSRNNCKQLPPKSPSRVRGVKAPAPPPFHRTPVAGLTTPPPGLATPPSTLATPSQPPRLYAVENTPDGVLSRRSSLSSLSLYSDSGSSSDSDERELLQLTAIHRPSQDHQDEFTNGHPAQNDLGVRPLTSPSPTDRPPLCVTYRPVAPPKHDLMSETMPVMSESLISESDRASGHVVLDSFALRRTNPVAPVAGTDESSSPNATTTNATTTATARTPAKTPPPPPTSANKPGQRPKAVSKIASLWKSPGTASPTSRSRPAQILRKTPPPPTNGSRSAQRTTTRSTSIAGKTASSAKTPPSKNRLAAKTTPTTKTGVTSTTSRIANGDVISKNSNATATNRISSNKNNAAKSSSKTPPSSGVGTSSKSTPSPSTKTTPTGCRSTASSGRNTPISGIGPRSATPTNSSTSRVKPRVAAVASKLAIKSPPSAIKSPPSTVKTSSSITNSTSPTKSSSTAFKSPKPVLPVRSSPAVSAGKTSKPTRPIPKPAAVATTTTASNKNTPSSKTSPPTTNSSDKPTAAAFGIRKLTSAATSTTPATTTTAPTVSAQEVSRRQRLVVRSSTYDKLSTSSEDTIADEKLANRRTFTLEDGDCENKNATDDAVSKPKSATLPANLQPPGSKVKSRGPAASLWRRSKVKEPANSVKTVVKPAKTTSAAKVNNVKPSKEFYKVKDTKTNGKLNSKDTKNNGKDSKLSNKDLLKKFVSNPFKKSSTTPAVMKETAPDVTLVIVGKQGVDEQIESSKPEVISTNVSAPVISTPVVAKRVSSAPPSPRAANEAIVPPYNYTPVEEVCKTDMLIERRRRTSECSDDRSSCLVTTV